jgi:hypothetical protein
MLFIMTASMLIMQGASTLHPVSTVSSVIMFSELVSTRR